MEAIIALQRHSSLLCFKIEIFCYACIVHEDHNTDDKDEDEKREMAPWGDIKSIYYGGDNLDFDLHSTDDEAPREEEKEIQKKRAIIYIYILMEDFGFKDVSEDETNRKVMSVKKKGENLSLVSEEAMDDLVKIVKVKKDLNALSNDE
ncbi:hypothetical protein V6N13_046357 [Hibiscus sabdariffa]|uniref:Uncharacterized protein n=1 Tax=Hibiscus sabdariffa TaxID=183260 RepID=A0ABR2D9W2_9ROSI